jgi:hypothetical protein
MEHRSGAAKDRPATTEHRLRTKRPSPLSNVALSGVKGLMTAYDVAPAAYADSSDVYDEPPSRSGEPAFQSDGAWTGGGAVARLVLKLVEDAPGLC